jgi:hypothetical protein
LEWQLLQRATGIPTQRRRRDFLCTRFEGREGHGHGAPSVVIAVTKGRSLLADGWDVFIIGPDGSRYDPVDFDRLFEIEPDARTET